MRACWGVLSPLHHNVIHRMRAFALAYEQWDEHPNAATEDANDFCTATRAIMSDLLELDENNLHCCLKGFVDGADKVETWARSSPYDGRTDQLGKADRHRVLENTVWSALLGRFDGHTKWSPLQCFACNDLNEHLDSFSCTRDDWSNYYRSTLVFPLQYRDRLNNAQFKTFGFLAFDSPKRNAFPGLPDAFDARLGAAERAAYHRRLAESSAFHLGSIIADTLAVFLRPGFERNSNLIGGNDDSSNR